MIGKEGRSPITGWHNDSSFSPLWVRVTFGVAPPRSGRTKTGAFVLSQSLGARAALLPISTLHKRGKIISEKT